MSQIRMKPIAYACLLMACPVLGYANPAVLPEVKVVDSADAAYAPKQSFAATKTDTPLLETPMSVQVVTSEMMSDQQVFSLKDSIRNISGVVSNSYEYYDFLQIRGFDNGYAANYRNGLQLQAITSHDMALVEQLEVVKGPSSTLYGRIEPGGFVNMVPKRPQADAATSLQLMVGSYGLVRGVVDSTGKLNEDGSLLYRVVGAWTESNSFMDHVQRRNQVGAVYLSWLPNSDFRLNLSLEMQDNAFVDTEDIGIPIRGNRPIDVRRSSYYGDPVAWELPNKANRKLYAFDWSLALNEQWKLVQRFHYDTRDEQQTTFWSNGFDGVSTMDRGLWFVQPDRKTVATNVDLLGDVVIAGMRHRLLFGMDYFKFTSQWRGFSGTDAAIPSIDVWNPRYGISASALRNLNENFFYDTIDEWRGIYAQDQISLSDRWDLLIGGRYDSARYGNGFSDTSLGAASAALSPVKDESFSPRVGLLYKLTPQASLYGSYSESFGANNGRAASGGTFSPQQANQVEFGAKGEFMNGRLTSSLVFFDLEKTNILTPDLSTAAPDDQIAIGKARNRGMEFDIAGRVSRHVSLVGSYTYIDSEITKDNSGNQGNRLPNVPEHSASLWGKYNFSPDSVEGWEMGAGLYLRSQREGDNANSWQLPGYGRVDGMVAYRNRIAGKRWTWQLNGYNLLDKEYYDRGQTGTGVKYGAPRTVIASVKVDF